MVPYLLTVQIGVQGRYWTLITYHLGLPFVGTEWISTDPMKPFHLTVSVPRSAFAH